MRGKRKLDHLNLAGLMDDGPVSTGFEDIRFVTNCLPELAFSEVSTVTSFLGKRVEAPLLINAISGGVPEAKGLNRALAYAARRMGIPMAVGSMTAALQDPAVLHTFTVAREENPDGFIAANVSAGIPPQMALEAVKLIGADALQLHLNAPQEAAMPAGEGDLSFRGFLDNIKAVVKASPVPVIVKEVGFGMAGAEARRLLAAGVKVLDTGGSGGTNFMRIESFRGNSAVTYPFFKWGIPSAATLLEVVDTVSNTGTTTEIVASGGIRSGLDIAKALAMGAGMAGIAGPLVRSYNKGGKEAVLNHLQLLVSQLRQAMFMLGVSEPLQLKSQPLIVLGETGKWLELRGIDLDILARRSGRGQGIR